MAIRKYANAKVIDIISGQSWERMNPKRSFRNKTAAVNAVMTNQSKYVLSHCAIMASVMTEDDPNDHLIKPEASALVNNNQDAWENTVLGLSYQSFRGAFNFVEHYQNSKAAKGHILDAILRKVHLNPTVFCYYVDLLVATDLKHESLVADIRAGRTKYMSMGCLTDLVVCSFCGARCTTPNTYCDHLLYNKGEFLFDEGGVPRRVAELCGHKSLPNGGVKFVEASWVQVPAFPGAVKRSIIVDEWIGPKTPYTHLASAATGIKKAASTKIVAPSRIEDAKLRASFDRLLR
jgi:hypothetical protein